MCKILDTEVYNNKYANALT